MNYGFINHNNDANEVPIIVRLDKQDVGYDVKLKLRNDKKDSMKFRVVDNLSDDVMKNFFGFVRFAIF